MDSVKHVLVVAPVTEDHRKRLVCKFPSLQFTFTTPSEATDEQIAAADVVFGNLTPARIQASERLRLLQLNSAGADGYIIPGVLHKDTALANATGAYGLTISEHMMGLSRQRKDFAGCGSACARRRKYWYGIREACKRVRRICHRRAPYGRGTSFLLR